MTYRKRAEMTGTIQPDFMIIGAQKCGTTWLWDRLKQHPGTDLRVRKELFFFSSSSEYRKGTGRYYSNFSHLDPSKVIGEASTDYFYDHVLIENTKMDDSLPTIPQLVVSEIPDIRVFVILRDPVRRAVSAYYHHMRRRHYSPFTGIRKADKEHPGLRIVERGYYARFFRAWQDFVPRDRIKCFILEEDLAKKPEQTLRESYAFLNLDTGFRARHTRTARNERWGWTHLLLSHYLGAPYSALYRLVRKTPLRRILSLVDPIQAPPLDEVDIEHLRAAYLPERDELERLIGRSLEYWSYS